MSDLWQLFLLSAFVDNMPLTLFLGLCTFLALSKKLEAAIGLGVAMIGVMGLTVPLNHLIYTALLAPGAWSWVGLPDLDMSYLALIAFIGVIAAVVQVLEMLLDRFAPAIHAAFGVFLPLLTVQCAILAGSLFSRAALHAGAIGGLRVGQWHRLCLGRRYAGGHSRAARLR
jgi:Na+-transporting NADH:ubiquinone oxidoreductase subunit E